VDDLQQRRFQEICRNYTKCAACGWHYLTHSVTKNYMTDRSVVFKCPQCHQEADFTLSRTHALPAHDLAPEVISADEVLGVHDFLDRFGGSLTDLTRPAD
jgi:hypothetical protein